MYKHIAAWWKEYAAYSRGERTGILILLVILLIVVFIPVFLSKEKTTTDMTLLKARVDAFERQLADQLAEEKRMHEPFFFDPNTADSSDFCRLGFSPAQTGVILRYRNKGGKFETADDFGHVYVVNDSTYKRLKSYIRIAKSKNNAEVNNKPVVVEVNSADTLALQRLPGIGSYFAKKIVDRRDKLGGFVSINQLTEIYGIDEERLSSFRHLVVVDTSHIKKININSIRATELNKHPYFDVPLASAIIKYRKAQGEIKSLNQLVIAGILSARQEEKIAPYITF